MQQHSQKPQQLTLLATYLKRKAEAEAPTPRPTMKKQKISPKQYVSKDNFRTPSSRGTQQRIVITQPQIPLTNAEAFRLRGWFWRRSPKDAVTCHDGITSTRDDECESPRGTKLF
ncbi:hypothetical protein DDE83_005634 [Stemphylium lycopersici]|uniref:Uncharacterized protein n=1 Tax=Stemphylium lycopersici TaxID=183478 RepID=A0A364N1A2_STELY|nr:hypothetical protein DDE83_005634 [Stemphylium lycopersici]